MTDVLPPFGLACPTRRNNSTDSFYAYGSDFGEGCPPESGGRLFPALVPVYNGRVLDIPPQLIHAGLSGISIKHQYGKCVVEEESEKESVEEENFEGEKEMEELIWLEGRLEKPPSEASKSYASSYREGLPLCTLPKIHFRNSFWNIHRPELCKLTWGQKYVSTATVIEHLHGHLLQHGPLCEGFHTEAERQNLLDKELDEYVRLKVLASPRTIPPDEPFFNPFPGDSTRMRKTGKKQTEESLLAMRYGFDSPRYFIPLPEDEEIKGRNIHRLKEEFCLTIGKHKWEHPMGKSLISLAPDSSTPQPQHSAEEEESFYYDWHLHAAEEDFDRQMDLGSTTQSTLFSDGDSLAGPCPPLILDEFCKAAGKVDFSDMRCPDL